MKNLIDKLMQVVKRYTVWDFGFFKFALFALGIIFGAYFYNFFLMYMPIIWVIFIISYLWLIYKTFFKYWK